MLVLNSYFCRVEKVETSGGKEKDDFVVYIGLACLSIVLYSIEVLFIGWCFNNSKQPSAAIIKTTDSIGIRKYDTSYDG